MRERGRLEAKGRRCPIGISGTASALGEIDMDVVLMVAVRTWGKYGRETLTNRRTYLNADVFRYSGVG
jgi:hypothetical protein